jgi:hypothetical protein
VIKSDVMVVIDEFQRGNFGLEKINRSLLFLLPKKSGTESLSDFRPITLSISIYLIIGKELVNNMRGVMQSIINLVQSVFLKGRSL